MINATSFLDSFIYFIHKKFLKFQYVHLTTFLLYAYVPIANSITHNKNMLRTNWTSGQV